MEKKRNKFLESLLILHPRNKAIVFSLIWKLENIFKVSSYFLARLSWCFIEILAAKHIILFIIIYF